MLSLKDYGSKQYNFQDLSEINFSVVNWSKIMKANEYKKLLNYFNEALWDIKVTETNWNYHGLILDSFFDMSVLSIDYLDINDFF